jgi:adenine/guanine phosphoribosyltransferase-like PRPP-binding protein
MMPAAFHCFSVTVSVTAGAVSAASSEPAVLHTRCLTGTSAAPAPHFFTPLHRQYFQSQVQMHARKQQAPDGVASPSLCPGPSPASGLQPPSKKRSMSNTSPHLPNDIQYLRSAIRVIPDFPKPGVSFKDITPLLRDPKAYNMLVQCMTEQVLSIEGGVHCMYACACLWCFPFALYSTLLCRWSCSIKLQQSLFCYFHIVCSASIESRGNLIAAPLAFHMKLPLVRPANSFTSTSTINPASLCANASSAGLTQIPQVLIRKSSKSPGCTVGVDFRVGYGTEHLEIADDSVQVCQKHTSCNVHSHVL